MAAYALVHDTGRVKIYQWVLTTADPTGAALFHVGHFPDKTIQAHGTFGGGTITLNGSNEIAAATSAQALNDVTPAAIGLTSGGIKQVLENTHQVYPVLSGSTGGSVTVLLLLSVAHR